MFGRYMGKSFAAVVILLLLAQCANEKAASAVGRFYSGSFMGQSYTIDVVGDSTDYSESLDSILAAVSGTADPALKGSVVARYNAWQQVDSMLGFVDSTGLFGALYGMAGDYHRLTGGIYDPTLNPIRRAWKERREKGWTKGEPDLDELYRYTGFDASRIDLIEMQGADGYTYERSFLRKTDPRIELDLSRLAGAYGMDRIAAFLEERQVAQWKITWGRSTMIRGIWSDSLCTIPLGITGDDRDQKIRLSDGAFSYVQVADKVDMIDPSYGYPPQSSELIFVAIVAPRLTDAIVLSEAFMIMGLEDATAWYAEHPDSRVESFMLIQRGEEITNASTEGFDRLLVFKLPGEEE